MVLDALPTHAFGYASDLTNQEGRIIGVEEELRGELSPELSDLLGRIDLLLETDDDDGASECDDYCKWF